MNRKTAEAEIKARRGRADRMRNRANNSVSIPELYRYMIAVAEHNEKIASHLELSLKD